MCAGIRHSRTDSLEEGASAWAAGRASMAGEGAMRATISPEESEEFLGWEEELAMPRFALRSGPRLVLCAFSFVSDFPP